MAVVPCREVVSVLPRKVPQKYDPFFYPGKCIKEFLVKFCRWPGACFIQRVTSSALLFLSQLNIWDIG